MRVWRICREKWSSTAFSGEGARLYGGRWNTPGTAMVYTAGSQALAVLELLVHVDASLAPDDLVLIPADVPDDAIENVRRATLPSGWRRVPAPPQLADLGDAWIASRRSVALRVPSAVVPDESNVLLNPAHPAFEVVERGEAGPFHLDPRLLRAGDSPG